MPEKDLVKSRISELTAMITDIDVTEKELVDSIDTLQEARIGMKKELYQLGGEANSTPLFLSVKRAIKRARA